MIIIKYQNGDSGGYIEYPDPKKIELCLFMSAKYQKNLTFKPRIQKYCTFLLHENSVGHLRTLWQYFCFWYWWGWGWVPKHHSISSWLFYKNNLTKISSGWNRLVSSSINFFLSFWNIQTIPLPRSVQINPSLWRIVCVFCCWVWVLNAHSVFFPHSFWVMYKMKINQATDHLSNMIPSSSNRY